MFIVLQTIVDSAHPLVREYIKTLEKEIKSNNWDKTRIIHIKQALAASEEQKQKAYDRLRKVEEFYPEIYNDLFVVDETPVFWRLLPLLSQGFFLVSLFWEMFPLFQGLQWKAVD